MATRVHLIAKELGVTSKEILDKCRAEGLDIKNHMTKLTAGQEATIRDWFSESHGSTTLETAAPITADVLSKVKVTKPSHEGDEAGDSEGGFEVDGEAERPDSPRVEPVAERIGSDRTDSARVPPAVRTELEPARPVEPVAAQPKVEPAEPARSSTGSPAPASTAPAHAPSSQVPSSHAPAAQVPAAHVSSSHAPSSQVPAAQVPSSQVSAAPGTASQAPASQAAAAAAPKTGTHPTAGATAQPTASAPVQPSAAAAGATGSTGAARTVPGRVGDPRPTPPQARPTFPVGTPPSGTGAPPVGPRGAGPSQPPAASAGTQTGGRPVPGRPGAPVGPGAGRPPMGPSGRPPLPGRPGAPGTGPAGAGGPGAPGTGEPPKKKVAAIPFVPAPAKLQGPNVVRVEQPDFVNKPRPRPAGPAGGGFVGREGDDDGGDRTRRRPGGQGPSNVPPKRRQAVSPRRKGGRDEPAAIKEWNERDILEQKERIRLANAQTLEPLTSGRARPGTKHTPFSTTTAARQGGGVVYIEEPITVKSLSAATGLTVKDILRKMMAQGMMVTINSSVTTEAAEVISADFNIELKVKRAPTIFEQLVEEFKTGVGEKTVTRAPVVTILGHVDHGKTSLLDAIRKSEVAKGEAGGITQHIGAWKVETAAGHSVVFIDTPGHTAFTAMRARGANMTDVVVLVVSPIDGGVMSTTIEAIDHARAAKVPIVIALTKMDLPQVDDNLVRKTLGQLAERGLMPREWGGDVDVVRTSANTGLGLEELLEHLAFTSEVLELKSDPEAPASGRVVEARMDPDRGRVATLLIQDGSMVVGDVVLCGSAYGRVRAMRDDKGRIIDEAGPSTPVDIIGLDEIPEAGEFFFITDDVARAKDAAEERKILDRRKTLAAMTKPPTMTNWAESLKDGEVHELKIILRADVQGSIDALLEAINKIGSSEVRVRIIRSAVGGISEADVELCRASDAVIIGFHVVPEDAARKLAEHHGVEIRLYRVIYEIIDDITRVLEGKLVPEKREEVLGHADVRQVFKVSRVGTVAGCYCTDGKILLNAKVRITRNNVVIADERELQSLRRVKDDVREVAAGLEFGMKVAGFDDIKEGDRMEVYQVIEIARKL